MGLVASGNHNCFDSHLAKMLSMKYVYSLAHTKHNIVTNYAKPVNFMVACMIVVFHKGIMD